MFLSKLNQNGRTSLDRVKSQPKKTRSEYPILPVTVIVFFILLIKNCFIKINNLANMAQDSVDRVCVFVCVSIITIHHNLIKKQMLLMDVTHAVLC